MSVAASARDNLRDGNWTATDEDLWDAARAANAEEFLRKLPQGLGTFMGEGGARLSGGQRQRTAKIGRTHVLTPVTHAHLVCRLPPENNLHTNHLIRTLISFMLHLHLVRSSNRRTSTHQPHL